MIWQAHDAMTRLGFRSGALRSPGSSSPTCSRRITVFLQFAYLVVCLGCCRPSVRFCHAPNARTHSDSRAHCHQHFGKAAPRKAQSETYAHHRGADWSCLRCGSLDDLGRKHSPRTKRHDDDSGYPHSESLDLCLHLLWLHQHRPLLSARRRNAGQPALGCCACGRTRGNVMVWQIALVAAVTLLMALLALGVPLFAAFLTINVPRTL